MVNGRHEFHKGEVVRFVDWDITASLDMGNFTVLRDFNLVRVLEWHHRKVGRFATAEEILKIFVERSVLVGTIEVATVECGFDGSTHTHIYTEEKPSGTLDSSDSSMARPQSSEH